MLSVAGRVGVAEGEVGRCSVAAHWPVTVGSTGAAALQGCLKAQAAPHACLWPPLCVQGSWLCPQQ